MKILGIDLSLTGTGIVALKDGKLIYNNRYTPKEKGIERILDIEKYLDCILQHIKPDFVAIEGYAYSRANQAHQIGELGGVIRRLLKVRGVRWQEVAPSQVKKFATGKGNCGKDLILQQVYKKWGQEFHTSDEADAFVLAKIGEALMQEGQAGLTGYQKEVLKKLKKGKGAA